MTNLTKRIITAIIGVPLLITIFYYGSYYFLLFIMLIIGFGSYEYFRLIDNKNINSNKVLGIVFSLILPLGAYFGYLYFIFIFTVVSILTLFLSLQKQEITSTLAEAGSRFLGIVYIGWFLSHAVLIRDIGENKLIADSLGNKSLNDIGFFWIVFVVSCTFVNDTVAFFVGNAKGKHKLAPRLSPGKTWEGTLSGIFMSLVCGIFINLIFNHYINYKWAMILGLIIGVAAVIGDLIESMFKRSVSIKDTGELLPGHGGILDRFDSLIIVFPVMYYLILFYYSGEWLLIF